MSADYVGQWVVLYNHRKMGCEFDSRTLHIWYFRACTLDIFCMVSTVCSWIPVTRGQGFALEVKTETESNLQTIYMLLVRKGNLLCYLVSAD